MKVPKFILSGMLNPLMIMIIVIIINHYNYYTFQSFALQCKAEVNLKNHCGVL